MTRGGGLEITRGREEYDIVIVIVPRTTYIKQAR
jgi:hypothetical protein